MSTPMTAMTLPQLAQVILDGSLRGKDSARFLLYEKIRIWRDTPARLDEVDEQGRTAAQILTQSEEDVAVDSFLHLLTHGATAPAETARVVVSCAERGASLYGLLECWVACEEAGRRLLPEADGNVLHIVAKNPHALEDMVGEITDPQRPFMQRWQAPLHRWMGQARGSDGATPLHVALQDLTLPEPIDAQQSYPRNLRAASMCIKWFVEQGGQLSTPDHGGHTMVDLLHPLAPPGSAVDRWLGPVVRTEIERATIDTQVPEVSEMRSGARPRL